ncbi:MAG TPA: sulfotransferase [Thermoanaerobaculia bacterium]|nr:sulfotransferase [Thermoanaerobaculia bacterium]
MQIFVLGMHRSGTSALARTLALLGCHAGDASDFPAADDANPRGYWERRDVWRLDEDLLQALGAAWDEVGHLNPDLLLSALPVADLEAFERRAREIVASLDASAGAAGPGRPWVVKDPRLCLTFPLWRRVLEAPVCVIIERSPLSVARSLAARDGFPLALGLALWERHLRSALAASAGLPRLHVRYEDLIDRPRETSGRLLLELQALGAEGLADPAEGTLEAFLDPALERHPREPEVEADLLNSPQQALLDALRTELPEDAGALSLGARDLLERHATDSRQRATRRVEIEGLYARLAETAANAERERAAFEAGLARAAKAVEVERLARREVETAATAERTARLEGERLAAQAFAAERESRERVEATAKELIEQARTLHEKIAQDSAAFALEHAERLRLEAILAGGT